MVLPMLVGAAVGLYGAKKSSDAAKDAQQARNDATSAQYDYDKQAWHCLLYTSPSPRDRG